MHVLGQAKEAHGTRPQVFLQGQQNPAPPIMMKERQTAMDLLKQYMVNQQEMAQQLIMKLSQ